jgi:heme exporter protein C
MWFTMFLLMIIAVWHSVAYLARQDLVSDLKASMMVEIGLLFCVLGLVTGSIWARFTWTSWWTNDPQLNGALVTFLIYCAYIILRRSIDDDQKRATISAVFNIFCFAMLVVLLMILPRFTESLHPGKGDNPAFSVYDRGNSLKMLFYPAVIGWILMGIWIYKLRYRAQTIRNKMLYDD